MYAVIPSKQGGGSKVVEIIGGAGNDKLLGKVLSGSQEVVTFTHDDSIPVSGVSTVKEGYLPLSDGDVFYEIDNDEDSDLVVGYTKHGLRLELEPSVLE